ncbi:hypothetical protein [Periweissella cryptocerci]|nr:hypothetical protein [Periweissella cryptocerci]
MWKIKKDIGDSWEIVEGISFRDAEQAGATAIDWTLNQGVTYLIAKV